MATNNFEEVLRILIQTDGGKDIADLAQKIVALGGDSEEARSKVAELISQITSSQQAQRAVETFRQLGASVLDYEKQISAAREKVATLGKAISETDAPTKRQQAAFEAARKSLAKLEATQEKQRTQLSAARSIIEANGLSVTKLGTAESVLAERVDRARTAVGKMASEAERSAAAHKRLNSIVGSVRGTVQGWYGDLGRLLSRLGRISGITTLVGGSLSALGAIRVFGSAIGSAKDFEQAITEVGAVAGASAEQLQRLKDAANTAGTQYGYTAQQTAEALNQLARASGNADDAIKQLPAVLALAKAGGVDLGTAAQFVVQTLNQFNLSADKSAKVADVLTKTANDTTASVESVGEAMSYAAPIAQQLGFKMNDVAAAVGELAQQGFDGSRAGTALRKTFIEMLNPSSQFGQQLRALNIDTSTFSSTIDGLAASGDRGTQAILSLGNRAAPAIAALVNNGRAGLKQLQQSLADAGGEADRTAKRFSDTFQGSATRLYAAFDSLRRGVLDGALVPLKNAFNDAAKAIVAFIGTADFTKLQQSVTAFVKQGISGVRQFVASIDFKEATARIDAFLGSSGKKMHDFFAGLGDTASKISTAFKTVGVIIDGFKIAIYSVGAALAKLAQGAAQVVLTFAQITDKLGLTKGKVDEVKTAIGGLGAVTDEFTKRIADAGSNIAHAFDETKVTIQKTAKSVDDLTTNTKKAAEQTQQLGTFSKAATDAFNRYEQSIHGATEAIRVAAFQSDALKKSIKDATGTTQADLDRAAKDAETNLNRIADAFRNGNAVIEDVRRAYDNYAQKVHEATAQSNADVQAQADQALKTKFDTLGLADAGASIGPAFSRGAREGIGALQGLDKTVRDARGTLDQATSNAQRGFTEWGDAADQAALATRGITADTSHANDAMQALSQGIGDARAKYQALSDAAAKFYDTTLKGAFDLGHSNDGSGFDRVARAMQTAIEETDAKIAGARQQLAGMIEQINQIGTDGSSNFGQFGNDAVAASAQMQVLSNAIQNGNFTMGLLGQQDLAPLQQALDAARQRVLALQQASEAAKQQLQDLAQQAHDALLQQQGNQVQLEDERHQKALDNLKTEAQAAGELNSQTYQQALKDENRLHQLKLANLEQQQQAQQQAQQSTATTGSSVVPAPTPAPAAGVQPAASAGLPAGVVQLHPITLDFGSVLAHLYATPQQARSLTQLVQELSRAKLLSTGAQ